MPKTVTVTVGPVDGEKDASKGIEKTKDILKQSGILEMLNSSGASVDIKDDSKLHGKITLYISETTTDFKISELLGSEIKNQIDEWIYTYLSNQ